MKVKLGKHLTKGLLALTLSGVMLSAQAAVPAFVSSPTVVPPPQSLNQGPPGLYDQGWGAGTIAALGTTLASDLGQVITGTTPGPTTVWTASVDQWVIKPIAGEAFNDTPNLGVTTCVLGSLLACSGAEAPGPSTNPLDSLGLIFVYQVTNTGGGLGLAINSVQGSFYSTFATMAGFDRAPAGPVGAGAPAGTTRPGLADRTVPDTVGFNFYDAGVVVPGGGLGVGLLTTGLTSAFLVVYTNAHSYNHLGAISLQGTGQGGGLAFQPVPEPETYAMMLAGLGLMGFVARRRKRKL